MKPIIACLLVVCSAVPAHAQSFYGGSPGVTLEAPYQGVALENRAATNFRGNSLETSTMRRQKLRRALALREKALRLQAQDGGVLSPEHVRYVRAASRSILAYANAPLTRTGIRRR